MPPKMPLKIDCCAGSDPTLGEYFAGLLMIFRDSCSASLNHELIGVKKPLTRHNTNCAAV
eukprot:1039098-Prorocentrum_minimum.AAC.2